MTTKIKENKREILYVDEDGIENRISLGFSEFDPVDFLYFLTWYLSRPNGQTCKDCILTKSMMSGKAPNCLKCGLPTARLLKKYFKKERPYEKV